VPVWYFPIQLAAGCAHCTRGLRLTMKAVAEKRTSKKFLDWLLAWESEPRFPFHRDGVRYALRVLCQPDVIIVESWP